MAGSSRWRRDRAAYATLREAERALEAERARVKAAEAEAEFAAHAHEELTRLAVQPNEEETLAQRRQAMMQGEKVAADIRDARDHLTGESAILPLLLSLSRRLQRRLPQAPTLLEPSVKALDEAIDAVERRPARSRTRSRPALSIPKSSSVARSACSRSGRWPASTTFRSKTCPRSRKNSATISRRSPPAAARSAASRRRQRRGQGLPCRGKPLSAARGTSARELMKAVNAELGPSNSTGPSSASI